jgi:UDP-N-acetylmuramate: L-alanyl-gamma-D-glutamyl-meso-diaminopimelate ligase
MRVHFIAIGGAVMHNLALALAEQGDWVTGSDDQIFEPSRSRLAAAGLLPDSMGWDADRITPDLDTVILGMHARADNPELRRARELGLQISSFPDFLYSQTRDKQRVVVGGSHGKTTVTALIMHVLRQSGELFDYMVGAQLEGFDTMVGLAEDSRVAVFEGDEYPASALDPRPKFLLYRPQLGVINGIAWDHMNVFSTEESYIEQFRAFMSVIEPGGTIVYFQQDPRVRAVVEESHADLSLIPYGHHPYLVEQGRFKLKTRLGKVPVKLIGRHNMQNIAAAREVCLQLGIEEEGFYEALTSFRGAARRLQLLAQTKLSSIYLDFAHAPSKAKATTEALNELWPQRPLIACLELHTYSSLNRAFLVHYRGTLKYAAKAVVFFDPKTLEHKGLPPLDPADVEAAFEHSNLQVVTAIEQLEQALEKSYSRECVLLFMSSGSFSGWDMRGFLAQRLTP